MSTICDQLSENLKPLFICSLLSSVIIAKFKSYLMDALGGVAMKRRKIKIIRGDRQKNYKSLFNQS